MCVYVRSVLAVFMMTKSVLISGWHVRAADV